MPTSLGPAEILVIMIVALIVLGPAKLPEAGRQVGKTIAEIRRWSQGLQDEIRSAIDPDLAAPSYPPQPAPPPTPVPTLPAETDAAREALDGRADDGSANGTVIGSNGYLAGAAPVDTTPQDPPGPPPPPAADPPSS